MESMEKTITTFEQQIDQLEKINKELEKKFLTEKS